MIRIENLSDCCGCGACADCCPKNAIRMVRDQKGFLYPTVEEQLCVNCGLCEKVCAFTKKHERTSTFRKAYGMRHLSGEILKNSSSGGAFTALSDCILEKGGSVYGAVLQKDTFLVRHEQAVQQTERDAMRGSKYVQSETVGIFKKIKEELQAGKPILFTGTPCACDALRSYIGKEEENLFTVDLLCHGVPSPLLLQEHIRMWENKKGKKAVNFVYRNKKYGHEQTPTLTYEDGSTDSSVQMKRLIKLYGLSVRESCYACPYASKNRVSDITIGDFWSANKILKIYDDKGMSLLFVNTEKGEKLFSLCKEHCFVQEVDPDFFKGQAVTKPLSREESTDSFWKDYFEKGYVYVLDRYARQTFHSTVYQYMLRWMHITRTNRLYSYFKSKI